MLADLPQWGCRYWQFVAGGEDCPAAGAGRIFVEPHDGAGFLLLSEPRQLSLLLDSLETRGPREKVKLIRSTACVCSRKLNSGLLMITPRTCGSMLLRQFRWVLLISALAVRGDTSAVSGQKGLRPPLLWHSALIGVGALIPSALLSSLFCAGLI